MLGNSAELITLRDRVDRLERKVREQQALIEELALKLDMAQSAHKNQSRHNLSEVHKYLDEGRIVTAVKAYREATGAGLVEAKKAVDQILSERKK